jgi:hypothetical protein
MDKTCETCIFQENKRCIINEEQYIMFLNKGQLEYCKACGNYINKQEE